MPLHQGSTSFASQASQQLLMALLLCAGLMFIIWSTYWLWSIVDIHLRTRAAGLHAGLPSHTVRHTPYKPVPCNSLCSAICVRSSTSQQTDRVLCWARTTRGSGTSALHVICGQAQVSTFGVPEEADPTC